MEGVIDFAHAVNASLTTSFAISSGVRDAAGVWTRDQARKLLDYTKAIGGDIVASEFFNEPTMPEYGGAPPGYDAAAYARDFAVFRQFAREAAPEMRIVGPASVGEAVLLPAMRQGSVSVLKTVDLLSVDPPPVFDIFSYHFYGAASIRCASMGSGAQTSPEAALSEEWLARADHSYAFYGGQCDRLEAGKPVWITEIADAACGGNPWANPFLDTFRNLEQHARLAKRGVSALFHNTLASSEYGLLDQNTFAPRPNYWAVIVLWAPRCSMRAFPSARACTSMRTAWSERRAGSRCLRSTTAGRKPRRSCFQSRRIATRCRRSSLRARQSS